MRHDADANRAAAANDCNCLLPRQHQPQHQPKQPQFHLSQVFILRVAKNEEKEIEREIAQHKEDTTKKKSKKSSHQGVCRWWAGGAHGKRA